MPCTAIGKPRTVDEAEAVFRAVLECLYSVASEWRKG